MAELAALRALVASTSAPLVAERRGVVVVVGDTIALMESASVKKAVQRFGVDVNNNLKIGYQSMELAGAEFVAQIMVDVVHSRIDQIRTAHHALAPGATLLLATQRHTPAPKQVKAGKGKGGV